MKNQARVRVHPLFAAVAMAVILLCLVEIASVTGKLEQWIGGSVATSEVRMSPSSPTTLSQPFPDIVQSKVGSITALDPSLQPQAVLNALALDPPTAGPQAGFRSTSSGSSGGTASGMTTNGTTASGGGR